MRLFLASLICLSLLSGCAGQYVWAPDEVVERVKYRDPGAPSLTLFTMVNNETGNGAHSALMVSGSQRVIFDPAGTVRHEALVERNDVIHGITPQILDFYTRAHARKTHHVVIQTVEVSPAVAEQALNLAINNGPVFSALCANATSQLLRKLPGFDTISVTFFPYTLMKNFRYIPGVREEALFEYDDADKSKALRAYDPSLVNPQ